MVAAKLSELAGKGWGWYSTAPPTPSELPLHAVPAEEVPSSSSIIWSYATGAAEQTYSTVSGYVSAVAGNSSALSDTDSDMSPMDPMMVENMPITPKRTMASTSLLTSPAMLNMFNNPYVSVRGGRKHQAQPPSSMEAVRSLLSVVPAPGTSENNSEASSALHHITPISEDLILPGVPESEPLSTSLQSSPAETASQLAEGTIRAFRDIALDEAVELAKALRYWSYRWERPLLSWLEAGPSIWFSEEGYQHQIVGRKVSQIQAVLARRCTAIGDVQLHLLRAGWQRGVAQWGVLGNGGEWAAVNGVDGTMPDPEADFDFCLRSASSDMIDRMPPPPKPPELPANVPRSNVSQLPQRSRHDQLYYTSVLVKNNDGGKIFIDEPALAEWSVDAMSLVRNQLFRASNGMVVLPFAQNWVNGDGTQGLAFGRSGSLVFDNINTTLGEPATSLPLWASCDVPPTVDEDFAPNLEEAAEIPKIEISDLPLMVSEVSGLLDTMETVMNMQRGRRLDKLQPRSWLRRNWYVGAIMFPPLTYFCYKAATKGYGWGFLKYTAQKLVDFFFEHVVEPVIAMYEEFTKGTENISDREARDVATEILKKMIRSWLKEYHPDMPAKERRRMAKAMDISLIEAEKEESMKTIYNLNSVVRMSFIEAQFIKKEMMNALVAMDEMRAATNFNMNLAAVTPFVLFVWAIQRMFKYVFYAMLRVGKSREETYGTFLHTLVEIERLLVMRDNPPAPPPNKSGVRTPSTAGEDAVLNAEDLGMLMLLLHELRTILWQDRSRFSVNIIRSVAEDLAELAGERGAVSVRQQLQIINRMSRTYPFLKSVTNRTFDYMHQ